MNDHVEPEVLPKSLSLSPPSRLNGWDDDVDNVKWNMIVGTNGAVVRPIPPHVRGTLRGTVASGERVVEIDPPTEDERRLYRSESAKVDGRKLVPVLAPFKKMRASEIDEGTISVIRRGFEYKGKKFSLSSNAVAKYTAARAVAALLSYPRMFSDIDNDSEAMFNNESELTEFVDAAFVSYLAKIASGDEFKTEIRRAATPEDVDNARAQDRRPRRRR